MRCPYALKKNYAMRTGRSTRETSATTLRSLPNKKEWRHPHPNFRVARAEKVRRPSQNCMPARSPSPDIAGQRWHTWGVGNHLASRRRRVLCQPPTELPETMATRQHNFQSPIVEGVGSSQVHVLNPHVQRHPCAGFPADTGSRTFQSETPSS